MATQQHRRCRRHRCGRWILAAAAAIAIAVAVAPSKDPSSVFAVPAAAAAAAAGADGATSSSPLQREDSFRGVAKEAFSDGGAERAARSATERGGAATEPTTIPRGILRAGGGTRVVGASFRSPTTTPADDDDRGRKERSDDASSKGAEAEAEEAPSTGAIAGERVRDAIRTLRAVGASCATTAKGPSGGCRPCHPSTDEFGAHGLPLCDGGASVYELVGDGFLEGKNRSPAGTVPLPEAEESSSPRRTLTAEEDDGGGEESEAGDRSYAYYVQNGIGAFGCVCVAALAAGLTMGLLSLDPLLLLIKIRAGETERERTQAANLLPLVKQHHRLLVTLLLLNAMANEALPLFLDKVVPGYVAVIMSVTLVLFFGEIIPSALFTGPNQMAIASRLSPLVKFVMALLCPVAYPIAKLLDCVMHEEGEDHGGDLHVGSLYNRGELSALVRIQYEERLASKKRQKKEMAKLAASVHSGYTLVTKKPTKAVAASAHSGPHFGMTQYDIKCNQHAIRRELDRRNIDYPSDALAAVSSSVRPDSSATSDDGIKQSLRSEYRNEEGRAPSIHFDEVNMVEGALSMKTKMAVDVYTPLRRVFAVPHDKVLTEDVCVAIYSSGYSRIPIYVPDADDEKKKRRRSSKGGDIEEGEEEEEEEEEEDISAICGLLLTRQLIVLNPDDGRQVSTLPLQRPMCVPPNINLVDLINIFQTGGYASRGGHMALVCARPRIATDALERGDPIPRAAGVMGIVTLEDVIEELLQEEIYDEMDKLERISSARAEWAVRKWRIFVKKRKRKRQREAQAKVAELVAQATEAAAEKAKDAAVMAAEAGEEAALAAAADDRGTEGAPSGDDDVVDPNFASPLLLSTAREGTGGGLNSYGSSSPPEFA